MSLTLLDATATAAALPHAALADALADMLVRRRAGQTLSPERLVVPLTGGVLLAMPASDGEYAVTKLVTVHADNPRRGLPSLLGEVLLMRADTGERLLMLDGPTVTARRTATLSALAARRLGAVRGAEMLVVGAGVQARAHLEAFAELLAVTRVWILGRDPARAEALRAHATGLGLPAEVVRDPAAALARCQIVVTATTALAPVMPDAVRVDRSLVARLPDAPDGRVLVKAIVAMARPLGMKVLADGVDTEVQKDFLKDIGVDEIEGRIAGLPMPTGDATRYLVAALDRCGVDLPRPDSFSMAHLLSH